MSIFKLLLKIIAYPLLLVLALLGILGSIWLAYSPTYENGVNQGLISHLSYLRAKLDGGAGERMQRNYPEGYFFINAVYGLSWAEVAQGVGEKHPIYPKAHQEIDWALAQLNSDAGHGPFPKEIAPEYGIFYRGWVNYLLGKKLLSMPDSLLLLAFDSTCADIAAAFQQQQTPFLESYSAACWPSDMTVGMASLALGNTLLKGKYNDTVKQWVAVARQKTDKRGLLPHRVHCEDGSSKEASKGSSQTLILHFLHDIDSVFAKEQFLIYKSHFLDYRLGLPGIREYAINTKGGKHIDSGPIVWDIGGAASIVGIRTMATFGENDVAIGLRNSIEMFGAGQQLAGEKRYLFGYAPMADAFIAWGHAMEAVPSKQLKASGAWWLWAQLELTLLWTLSLYGLYRLWRPSKKAKA